MIAANQFPLARRAAGLVAATMLLFYVWAVLHPFQLIWPPLELIDNGVKRTKQGTLLFERQGIGRTVRPPAWLTTAIEAKNLAVKLRVRPLAVDDSDVLRIISISSDRYHRNLTIGQELEYLTVHIRTTTSDPDGNPVFLVPDVFAESTWTDVEVTIAQDLLQVDIDGQNRLSGRIPEGSLLTWNARYPLALGNELTGERPWLGEIASASVYVSGDETDYCKDGALDVPTRYWRRTSFPPLRILFQWDGFTEYAVKDTVLNLVYFVVLGFLLAASRAPRPSVLFAVGFVCVVSLCGELLQILSVFRVPSAWDWILNTSGAAIGGILAGLLTQFLDPPRLSFSR